MGKDGQPRSYLDNADTEAILIATDVNYSYQDLEPRPYHSSVVIPYIHFNKITAVSPIYSGKTSVVHFFYDLLGTISGKKFPVSVELTQKAPDVTDNVSGTYDFPAGPNVDLPAYFQTMRGKSGTYDFTIQFKVPCDKWEIPQIKTEGSWTVVVLPTTSLGSVRSQLIDAPSSGILSFSQAIQ